MRINNITSIKNYTNQNFKAKPYKSYVDISFNESDMERGSIVGSLVGLLIAGRYLTKKR